jgi:fumarate hydratase class II
MIRAFGIIKQAACEANLELKTLDPKVADLIMVRMMLAALPSRRVAL